MFANKNKHGMGKKVLILFFGVIIMWLGLQGLMTSEGWMFLPATFIFIIGGIIVFKVKKE